MINKISNNGRHVELPGNDVPQDLAILEERISTFHDVIRARLEDRIGRALTFFGATIWLQTCEVDTLLK